MKIPLKDFKDAIEILMRDEKLSNVVIFCSPLSDVKQRVKATRKFCQGRAMNEILITFGKPNYAEREFLRLCKKADTKPRRSWLKFKTNKK